VFKDPVDCICLFVYSMIIELCSLDVCTHERDENFISFNIFFALTRLQENDRNQMCKE
jgi:hypothetical protein